MNKKNIIQQLKNNNRNFYILLLITFIFILFSHPFLKYPYDMWNHLIRIDDVYTENKIIHYRENWYLFWAETFHLFSIDDFFIRARIIHIVQTIICLFSVFLFSRVLIRNIFKDINSTNLNYLSYWSVLIWLTIYATHSMYTHQVWIMWYSISYQISLAFFWYITALTLILFLEELNWPIKLFYCIQVVFFSYVMLSIHPMELGYYFVYLSLLGIVFFDKIINFVRVNFRIFIPATLAVIALLYYFFNYHFNYNDKIPPVVQFINDGLFVQLYETIMRNGMASIDGGNRASTSINELMVVIFFIGLFFFVDVVRKKILNVGSNVHFRLFLFIIISALFVITPLFQFTAGLLAVFFSVGVVNRVYYSSSLYVLLPISVYYFWSTYNQKVSLSKINISVIFIILSTFFYSRFFSESHNYYKNVMSLVNSFDERKVGFQLSQDNIETIGVLLDKYEKDILKNGKKVTYFARSDVSLVLKYIYKRDVYQELAWNGAPPPKTFEHFAVYSKDPKVLKTKIPIIFRIPRSFPRYIPYR
ncbi:MAG TPA: hypothetical protein EYQ43_08535 [Methyloprofundus sp.]|nr:hypothetical protein [Methyloprofundus sp.]